MKVTLNRGIRKRNQINRLQKLKRKGIINLQDLVLIRPHQKEMIKGRMAAKTFKNQMLKSTTIEELTNIQRGKRNILIVDIQRDLTNHKRKRKKNGQKEEKR